MNPLHTIHERLPGPRDVLLELKKQYHRTLRGRTGVRVMEEDWDNLVVLDACRYDLFEDANTLPGELRRERSSDSSTSGFLRYNFADETFPDTVYVSANPQLQSNGVDGHFHATERLWESDWDDDLDTVPPDAVTDRAIAIHDEYPQKRLIVHYVQPHYPFIGETGREIEHGTITGDGVIRDERAVASVWDRLEAGQVDADVVWEAYRENLELALPEVQRLLDHVVGKTVVTSDHGNALGEFGVYGHPGGLYLDSLVTVPWLTIDGEQRKTVVDGAVTEEEGEVEALVEDRLEDLGYV